MIVRRPVRRRSIAVLIVPAVALLAACTGDDSTPAVAGGQELKIGMLAPLKGPNAMAGIQARRGAELAVDVINGLNPSIPLPLAAEAGLPNLGGAKVSLVVQDAAPTAENDAQVTAGSGVNRLVSVEGADVLLGAYDPQVTEYASQRSERYEVPFVNADSPATFLTDAGRDWFFRIGPSWRSAGEAFFSLLRQTPEIGSARGTKAKPGAMMVVHARDKAGQDVVTTIRELATEGGLGKVAEVSFEPNATDLLGVVDQIRAANPDTVFLYATPTNIGPLTQAFTTRGYKPKVALSFALGFVNAQQFSGNAAMVTGLLRSVSWSTESAERNPAAQAVTALYQRRFNSPMTESAASAFTAVMTVAQAANNAGAVDNQRIRSALLSLAVPGEQTIMPWAGIQFDETHQNVLAQSLIEQFADRTFKIVYPNDAANASMIYPAPNSTGG